MVPARVWPAVLWTALLVAACFVPLRYFPSVEWALAEPLVHVVLFAVSTGLWLRAAPRATAAVVAGGVALAVATELAQGHPAIGRGTEVMDGALDLAGVALGLALTRAARFFRAPAHRRTVGAAR